MNLEERQGEHEGNNGVQTEEEEEKKESCIKDCNRYRKYEVKGHWV